MERIRSSVGSAGLNVANTSVFKTLETTSSQYYKGASASIAITGTPGDADHRQFLTDQMAGFTNVQYGNYDLVMGSIARKTDMQSHTDINPGVFSGLYGDRGVQSPQSYQHWSPYAVDTNPYLIGKRT
jgi:hypothetical protein